MSLALSGIGVSRGVAIGKAHILRRGLPEVTEYAIPRQLIKDEVARFTQALDTARKQLKAVRSRIPADTSAEIASFIDTHLLMLKDSALAEVPINLIRSRKCNAEWALKLQRDALVSVFEQMDDPYLRTRKDDVDHVVARIQRILLNQQEAHAHEDEETPLKGRIVVADDLTPADTVLMQHLGIVAFVTEYGGPQSHTAIIARNLRIPAVAAVRHARRYLRDDEELIVDGRQGVVLAQADEPILRHYRKVQTEERRYQTQLARLKGEPAITRDGCVISLQANIELPDDVHAARRVAAAGIGLYRTESLFMNRETPPEEEEQLRAYLKVLNGLKGAPVTIRTLDLGADKQVNGDERPTAPNPALGLRAIRLCLKDLNLFRPQLRAILRASAHGPVRMMVPMLSNVQEILQVLQLVTEARQELDQRGQKYDPEMPIGGMIEVPAAAIAAPAFAKHLDFMSIGTNDLIQYTLAIDRVADEVNYLYDPLHPAVLHLIHHVIEAGRAAGVPVAMCGEMAGDTRYTRLLLGLGLTEFSMQPATLLEVKSIINASDAGELAHRIAAITRNGSSEEIAKVVEQLNRE